MATRVGDRPWYPGAAGSCSPEAPPLSAFTFLNKWLQVSSFLLCHSDFSSALQKFPSRYREGEDRQGGHVHPSQRASTSVKRR